MKRVLDYRIVLAIALSAVKTADSFTIPARRGGATEVLRPTTTAPATSTLKSSSLFAGLSSTGDYLSGLSDEFTVDLVDRSRTLSSTEDYLKSLAQFVDYTTSTGASWEQQAAGWSHSVESSSFAVADALPKGGVPPEAAGGSDSLGPSMLRELSTVSYDSLKEGASGASSDAAKMIAEYSSGAAGPKVDSLIVDNPIGESPWPPVELFSFDFDMSKVLEEVSEFPSKAGTVQVAELGKSMIGGLQKVGGLFLEALNASVNAVSGSTLSEILASAQASANALVDGAIQQVISTVNHIGDMTVMQVAQLLVTIIITVTSTLWKIFNAVVGVVSGKTAAEWAIATSQTLAHDANLLTAKAAGAATDFSERSLSELVAMSASFLHDSTDLLAQGLQGMSASLAASDAMGDVASASVGMLSSLQIY